MATPQRATSGEARAALPSRPLRRQPFPHEIAAATDFAALDVLYEESAERLHGLFLSEWLPAQMDALEAQILAADSEASLSAIRAPVVGVEALTEELLQVARSGAAEATAEIGAQGLDLDDLDDETLRALVADHAAAVGQQVADGVSLAASRRAVQLHGVREAAEVATETRSYLANLEHRWERDQLAGAVQQATNAGRLESFERIEAVATIYASELLDARTCPPCAAVDGREFESIEEARRYYPSGGYWECEGGPRCRGTLVVVRDES